MNCVKSLNCRELIFSPLHSECDGSYCMVARQGRHGFGVAHNEGLPDTGHLSRVTEPLNYIFGVAEA